MKPYGCTSRFEEIYAEPAGGTLVTVEGRTDRAHCGHHPGNALVPDDEFVRTWSALEEDNVNNLI